MTSENSSLSNRAISATVVELALVALLVASPVNPVLLLLLVATQSLWVRGLNWRAAGLRWPESMRLALLQGVAATVLILVAVRFAIVPGAVWLAGQPIDLSALGEPGDARGLQVWLAVAWTQAAFGEEMVFRGYLIPRIADVLGHTRAGVVIAVVASSALFGFAHLYQGWAGVIATGTIGLLLAILYLSSRRNLWPAILCHGLVDTAFLSAIYFDRLSWFFPG